MKKMQQIWEVLSKVNANEFKDKRGKFDYLPWSDAWVLLMQHFPNSSYEFRSWEYQTGEKKSLRDVQMYADGTAAVECILTVEGNVRTMSLPVMNYNNQPIANPNSFQINTAKMRCLVKAMAMFGLGIYIFAGEDLPPCENSEVTGFDSAPVTSDEEMLAQVKNKLSKASQQSKLDNVMRNPKVSLWMKDLKNRDVELYGKVYDTYQLYKNQIENGRKLSNVN